MAVAGGMTGAYNVTVRGFMLEVLPKGPYPSTDCIKVADAVEKLQRGETVIVAAGDIAILRQRLASFAIGV